MTWTDDDELRQRFVLERAIGGGEGGGSVVRERGGGPPRFLKVLGPDADFDEAALLTSLQHPRIPAILEVGRTSSGTAFALREFVPGAALDPTADRSAEDIAQVGVDLLEVLAYVHLRGILHQDVKPANVVADDDGRLHLVDFGLGRRRAAGTTRGGTPFFAAPEQGLGAATDARTDLFGIGALLVALIRRGRVDLAGFFRRFPGEPFLTALGVDAADLPGPLARVLPRMLAREPADRFADAQEALEALRGGGSGRPPVAALRIDPVEVHRAALQDRLARLGTGQDLVISGGTPDDRRALALHAACLLGDVHEVAWDARACRLDRGGGTPLGWDVPELTAVDLIPRVVELLGLDGASARQAAARLVRAGASAGAVTAALRALAEDGSIVPDEVRWTWPDALAGRLDRAEAPRVIDDASAIRRAATRGMVAAAEAGYRRLAARHPADEPALRAALADGLLRAGEALRALPLSHGLPLRRARALLDLGRADDAEAELATAAAGGDEARRMEAMIHLLRGRADEALACSREFEDPGRTANRILRGSALAVAGRHEEARAELEAVVNAPDGDDAPYLRAVALTNLGDLARRGGDAARARALHAEALDLHRDLGHVRNVASASLNVGVVAKDLAQYDDARDALRRARRLYEHVGDRAGAAVADANLGIVQLEAGDPASAIDRFDRVLPLLESLGQADAARLVRAFCQRAHDALEPQRPPAPPQRTTMEQPEGIPKSVFRAFLAINRRLASARDLESAMRHLLDVAETLTDARAGYLLVARDDTVRVEVASSAREPGDRAFSRSLANRAISEMRTMTAADALSDRSLVDMPSVRELRVRSAVCVPFRSAVGLAGALYVEHGGRPDAFGPRDVEVLEALADQAAIAVDRMAREQDLAEALARSQRDLAVATRQSRSRARPKMLGESPPMRDLRAQIERLGHSGLSVLIEGETGSGKELVARALHDASPVRSGPFVSENCSAIPADLIESELFGHVAGAFTSADSDRAGLFELAHGGTLFLDEVGDMPVDMQVKLLRVLQEGRVRRVGGNETIPVDVRLLTATHRDLEQMVGAGDFRQDLYYRVAAGVVRVPPLRDRGEDIALLARAFVERLSREHGRDVSLDDAAVARLAEWRWPGNVRELEHVVARAFLLSDGDTLSIDELPNEQGVSIREETADWPVVTLDEATRRTIRAALRHTDGDKTAAAKLLGMSRTALYDRLKRDPEL